MTKEVRILTIIAVLVIIGGGLLLLREPKMAEPGKPVDNSSLTLETSHMTGNADAKVTIVEFGDYQCPACGAANPIIKKVIGEYHAKDLIFVYRHFPLTSIHKSALPAAYAAEAAGAQGKYWEMHNLIFDNQSEWSESNNASEIFERYAAQLSLDLDKFKSDISGGVFTEVVNRDFEDGKNVGVNSTPTFFVNGEEMVGVPKYDELKQKIDAELAK